MSDVEPIDVLGFSNGTQINGKDGYDNIKFHAQNIDAKPAALGSATQPSNSPISQELEKPESDNPEEKPKVVGVFEVFRFADKIDKLLIFFGVLFSVGHGAAMPAMIIVFGEMIDTFVADASPNVTASVMNFTSPPAAGSMPGSSELVSQMKVYALYYMYIGLAVFVFGYAQVSFWLTACYRQTYRIRAALFKSILRQDIAWYDTTEVAELNNRITDDVNKISDGISEKIGNFFQWMSSFIVGFIIGFIYGWKLTLVIIAVSPSLVISGYIMTKLTTSFSEKELSAYAKAGAVASEIISSIRTVTAFGGQEKACKDYRDNLGEARRFGVRKGLVGGGGMGVAFLIMFLCYGLAFWYGAKLVRDEDYTVGKMLIVFFCILIGAFSLGNAAPNLQNFATARGAAYIVYSIIDRVPPIDSYSKKGETLKDMNGSLSFRDVHFSYPSREEVSILNGLTFDANVGQTVAIVGGSGCGKSTVIQLLLRFYDPVSGSILLDGKPITSIKLEWLRKSIALVGQEPILFGTTIAENIRYGLDGVSANDIQLAAIDANAHDFIMQLPDKYETLVGERGAQLSGGQKQRIAIARALIRNPRILLLDEATSALDTGSEATVQQALDKARLGRTTIVIAHRLSTIRTADMIISIDEGKVSEVGTHEQLMEKKGIYWTLVTNQTLGDGESEGPKNDIQDIGSKKHAALKKSFSVDESKNKETEEKEVLPKADILRIMRLNSPETGYIILGCIGALASGAVQPLFAIFFANFLGVFALPDLDDQKREANIYALVFCGIGVLAGVSMLMQSFFFSYSGEMLTERVRDLLFQALMKQDIEYFDDKKNSTGALTTRLSTDASAVQGATGSRLGTVCNALSSLGVGLIIGFVFSWKLTLIILLFVPFIAAAGFLQMKLLAGSSFSNQTALETAGKIANESISNIRTIASLTREMVFYQLFLDATKKPHQQSVKKAQLSGLAFGASSGLLFFAYAACFYFGGLFISRGELTFVDMFKVFGAIVFGAMSVGQASQFAPDYGKAQVATSRIFMLLDLKPKIGVDRTTGTQPGSINGNIKVNSVVFHYPTRPTVTVHDNLLFDIIPGQNVALVGESGCGKSTVIQLLERFYDPDEGNILLDGTDLKSFNIQWLRSQFGLVQQEPVLFDTTIRENIEYGDNSRSVSMAEVQAAASKANIHDFISRLPQGYETRVGDKGAQISGGQKQRIAIARALVRDPKILLLDEATSALDTESEKIVQAALDEAQKGRTSIVIAHRLSTIQHATKIIIFDNGKVVEQGTHTELMELGGHYYRLQKDQVKS